VADLSISAGAHHEVGSKVETVAISQHLYGYLAEISGRSILRKARGLLKVSDSFTRSRWWVSVLRLWNVTTVV